MFFSPSKAGSQNWFQIQPFQISALRKKNSQIWKVLILVLTAIVLCRLCNTYLSTLMVFAEQTWTQNPERSCWRGLVWESMGGWKNKTSPSVCPDYLVEKFTFKKSTRSSMGCRQSKDICNYLFLTSDMIVTWLNNSTGRGCPVFLSASLKVGRLVVGLRLVEKLATWHGLSILLPHCCLSSWKHINIQHNMIIWSPTHTHFENLKLDATMPPLGKNIIMVRTTIATN